MSKVARQFLKKFAKKAKDNPAKSIEDITGPNNYRMVQRGDKAEPLFVTRDPNVARKYNKHFPDKDFALEAHSKIKEKPILIPKKHVLKNNFYQPKKKMSKKASIATEGMLEKLSYVIPIPGPTTVTLQPFPVDEKSRKGLREEHKRNALRDYAAGLATGGASGGFAGLGVGEYLDHKADKAARATRSFSEHIQAPFSSKYKKINIPLGIAAGSGLGALATKALRERKEDKIDKAKHMKVTATDSTSRRARKKATKKLLEAAKSYKNQEVPTLKGFEPVDRGEML